MAIIPNPTQAVIERLNVIRAGFLGKIADCRMRQGYADERGMIDLEGRIKAYAEAVSDLDKALKDIARDNHPHRQDSTRPLWMVDPLGHNNPEEND
jgi:hypothetical protein